MTNSPIKPHPPIGAPELRLQRHQFEVPHSPKPFRVLVTRRNFGKPKLAQAKLVRAAQDAPNRNTWYVAPSKTFAKHTIWPRRNPAAAKDTNRSEHHFPRPQADIFD